jgi:hypothetical protein
MVIAWSFSENDYICNEPRIQSTYSHIYFPWIFVRGVLNQELYIQEDEQEWSTRTRTAQVSFHHFQVSYLRTVLITVFNCSRNVRVTAFTNCVLSLFFFFFFWGLFSGPAHVLCLTVASGWNKERCIPEILSLLLTKLFFSFEYCVTLTLLLLQGDTFDLPCLQHVCSYTFMLLLLQGDTFDLPCLQHVCSYTFMQ